MGRKSTWKRVVFAAECDGDLCPVCGIDYAECPCPGPTMDGYEYRWRGKNLFARPIPEKSKISRTRRRYPGGVQKVTP